MKVKLEGNKKKLTFPVNHRVIFELEKEQIHNQST